MNVYLDFLLKASISMSIMYALYWLLLRNMTHFKANRIFLIASVILAVVCAAFPVRYEVLTTAPQVMQDSELADLFQRNMQDPLAEQTQGFDIDIWGILLGIYCIGLLVVLLQLIIQTWKPLQIILRTTPVKVDNYLLHENTTFKMPFSFFNRILIHPEYFKQNEINDILAHEKVHIQERHWIDLLIIELLTVLFWFNPFIWLFERAIKQNHEYLADNGVLSRGQSPVRYQALLINQLMGTKVIGLANYLNFALGPTRFKMMTKEKTSKRKLYRMIWLLPVLAVLMYSFAQPNYKLQEQNSKAKSTTIKVPKGEEFFLTLKDGSKVYLQENSTFEFPQNFNNTKRVVKLTGEAYFEVAKSEASFIVTSTDGETISALDANKETKTAISTNSNATYSLSDAEKEEYVDVSSGTKEPVDENTKQATVLLKGTVKDKTGSAIPGVSIVIRGTTMGTVSDLSGSYELKLPEKDELELIVSFVGYQNLSFVIDRNSSQQGRINKDFVLTRKVIMISNEDLKKQGDVPPPPIPKKFQSDETKFVIVESMPKYPRGYVGLAQHVKRQKANLKEKFFFKSKKLEGSATVGFTVNPSGEVSNIQILKKSNDVAAEAAKIIASKMEKWKAGSQRGKKVPVDFALELDFE
ncbi:M56 family metallopeptidase [Marinifilum sp.]|uniref:M56 family metallopeptidase n=1 Tax=Marinifilum sp. TaxID=2033137 RepID=UPI003BABBE94